MDVEALVKRLRECGCHYGIPMERTCAEAADALAALSADLSMATAAAETARASSDHWEARVKELEQDRAADHERADSAADRATALAAEVERLRKALKKSAEGWSNAIELGLLPPQHIGSATILRDEARAALEGKDNG